MLAGLLQDVAFKQYREEMYGGVESVEQMIQRELLNPISSITRHNGVVGNSHHNHNTSGILPLSSLSPSSSQANLRDISTSYTNKPPLPPSLSYSSLSTATASTLPMSSTLLSTTTRNDGNALKRSTIGAANVPVVKLVTQRDPIKTMDDNENYLEKSSFDKENINIENFIARMQLVGGEKGVSAGLSTISQHHQVHKAHYEPNHNHNRHHHHHHQSHSVSSFTNLTSSEDSNSSSFLLSIEELECWSDLWDTIGDKNKELPHTTSSIKSTGIHPNTNYNNSSNNGKNNIQSKTSQYDSNTTNPTATTIPSSNYPTHSSISTHTTNNKISHTPLKTLSNLATLAYGCDYLISYITHSINKVVAALSMDKTTHHYSAFLPGRSGPKRDLTRAEIRG